MLTLLTLLSVHKLQHITYNTMSQIFSKDPKEWSIREKQQAQQFLQCNKFFSKIYEHKHTDQLFRMAYYLTVSPQQPILLANNKRPAAIILLSGDIAIYNKYSDASERRKKKRSNLSDYSDFKMNQSQKQVEQYVKVNQLVSYNDTVIFNSQCKLVSMHGIQSTCIFVPSFMYNKYIDDRKQQKNQITYQLLSKIFKIKEKKPILDMAKSGCKIKQLMINNHVYREGDIPINVYIILEGSIKIGEPDRLANNTKNKGIRILSADSLLGDNDLGEDYRVANAICCSSHARLLQIPKDAFLKFARSHLPAFYQRISPKIKNKKLTEARPSRILSQSISIKRQLNLNKNDHIRLPTIFRYKSLMRSAQEQDREYKLIKNSHILLDVSPPRMTQVRSKSSFDDQPRDIMYRKSKLFKKIRPDAHRIDLSHRIF